MRRGLFIVIPGNAHAAAAAAIALRDPSAPIPLRELIGEGEGTTITLHSWRVELHSASSEFNARTRRLLERLTRTWDDDDDEDEESVTPPLLLQNGRRQRRRQRQDEPDTIVTGLAWTPLSRFATQAAVIETLLDA